MNTKFGRGVMALVGVLIIAVGESTAAETCEAPYRFIGDYPGDANPGWHENVQGLAHDDDHWYITTTLEIWKITRDFRSLL